MQSSLRSLLWLAASVSLCMGAVWITLDFSSRYDGALQNLVPFVQHHKRNLSAGLADAAPASGYAQFSGLQILYQLRGWGMEGVEVKIDGIVIPAEDTAGVKPPREAYDQDIGHALSMLDLQAMYSVTSLFNAQGRLSKLSFNKQ